MLAFNTLAIDDDVTTEEIQVALRKLKPMNASGVDGLESEHMVVSPYSLAGANIQCH